jgi:hypothetical protein
MPHGGLEGPIAKLQRAAEHYLAMKSSLGGRDHQLLPLKMVTSEDRLRYDFYAEGVSALPADLPLVLGDAYYNLRAALDHLVYQMHERHYRGKVPANIAEKTQFPIRLNASNSGPDSWVGIKHLAGRERTAIAWLQPYRQRNDALHGIREHLADISKINNIDKHQRLHIIRSLPQAVPTMESLSGYGLHQNPAFGNPIESGSLVNTWIFDNEPSEDKMARSWKFRSGAIFEARGYRIDLIPHLGGSIHAVAQILHRFSYLFPNPAVPLDISRVRPIEQLP